MDVYQISSWHQNGQSRTFRIKATFSLPTLLFIIIIIVFLAYTLCEHKEEKEEINT